MSDNNPEVFRFDHVDDFLDLPIVVHWNLLKYLDHISLNRLKRTSKYMRNFINTEYGNHVVLPCLSTLPRLPTDKNPLVTSQMLDNAVNSMSGKVIRILDINEMPSALIRKPLQQLLLFPNRVEHLILKYMDISLIDNFLRHCNQIVTFKYETGNWRHSEPQKTPSWNKLLQFWSTSLPKPSVNVEFIQKAIRLPTTAFQLDRLSKLTISLVDIQTRGLSDWANVLFLLLKLPSSCSNLWKFKFTFNIGTSVDTYEYLQIIACVINFVLKCPTLRTFEYHSSTQCLQTENFLLQREFLRLPHNVINSLIQNYGDDQLIAIGRALEQDHVRRTLPIDRVIAAFTDMVTTHQKNCESLRKVYLKINDDYEVLPFTSFLFHLPNIQECKIDDCTLDTFSLTRNRLYSLLFNNVEAMRTAVRGGEENIHPFWGSIQSLHVTCSDKYALPGMNVVPLSLNDLLGTFKKLKHLEVKPYHYTRNPNPGSGNRIADFSIQSHTDGSIFANLEVLKLTSATMLSEDISRLNNFKNLKELRLDLIRPYYITGRGGSEYAARSEDVISIVKELRKLDEFFISRVYFPAEIKDKALALQQKQGLQLLGSLVATLTCDQYCLYKFSF